MLSHLNASIEYLTFTAQQQQKILDPNTKVNVSENSNCPLSEYEADQADQAERRREPRHVHSFTFSSLSRWLNTARQSQVDGNTADQSQVDGNTAS